MDIPTSNIILDGVKFKVSEELKVKHQCAGSNVHIKDIHVLLQKNNVSFSFYCDIYISCSYSWLC